MRRWPVLVLTLGISVLTMGIGGAVAGHVNTLTTQRTALGERAQHQAQLVDHYATRAESVILLTANNPAFARFYTTPRDRAARVAAGSQVLDDANGALDYLEDLYPGRIGEACFIDDSGAENARVVRGERAPVDDLSLTEYEAPFFAPTLALRPGQVYHAKPYVSPDTDEWVISNSTPVPGLAPGSRALVHFEVTIESFRVEAKAGATGPLLVVDADTGEVIVDAAREQQVGVPLGAPTDRRFVHLVKNWGDAGGFTLAGRMVSYRKLVDSPTNDNHWYVVALAEQPTTALTGTGKVPLALVAVALLLIAYAAAALRRRQSTLVSEANTDSLTGLRNRRRLTTDLAAATARASSDNPALLVLYDLNGFKSYNDTFGHPAGDALLTRLGRALADAVGSDGTAYRMGGDEFCVLASPRAATRDAFVTRTVRALSEHGDSFHITAAYGAVLLPTEARDSEEALRVVDVRMYEQKTSGRVSAEAQTMNALVRALHERDSGLSERLGQVAELAAAVSRHLGLPPAEETRVTMAARMHDIGKVAIPADVLDKAGPLSDEEWSFVRQSPTIGARIAGAAPALSPLAPLILSARECYDGTGYPDNLAGEQIPLGARIIAACSSFAAMTNDRPYANARSTEEALAEMRRGTGTQFDPDVVAALVESLTAVHLPSPSRP